MPENSDIKVLALVGSLRAASINRQIAELAAAVAPDGVTVSVFEGLGELPFYNEEIDDATNPDAPALAPVAALRAAAADADAALVVTPEYNGSYSGGHQERDRLAVAPLRRRRAEGQAVGGDRRVLRSVRRGVGARRRPASRSGSPVRA